MIIIAKHIIIEFRQYRGGCIICMDFYYYSQYFTVEGYAYLRVYFDDISAQLLNKLQQLEQQNFPPSNGYLVGHSFGSQIIINAGRDFGGKVSGVDGNCGIF